jgi:hypothetical protein
MKTNKQRDDVVKDPISETWQGGSALAVTGETQLAKAEPDDHQAAEVASGSRTTASESRFCEGCGRPLTGRKRRCCSDRCRIRTRRQSSREEIKAAVARIDEAWSLLKQLVLAGSAQ